MEVHAHTHPASDETHTARKKWSHYFWEFFMLFLAVTAGFLVENQREHYVEHQREKQFIRSLLVDVKLDTANLNRYLRENMFDSLTLLINNPGRDNYTRDIYFFSRHITRLSRIVFNYNNRTMQQLKNSGALRLIRNRNAADSIIIYDAKVSALEKLEQREINYVDFCLPSTYKILDGLIYDKMIYDETEIRRPDPNAALLHTTLQTLPEFNLTLHNVKSVNRIYRKNAIELLQSAIQLLNTLNKEYKLE
jgi:hypothetical protein